MAITTASRVKTVLGMDSDAYDVRIEVLIPLVEEEYLAIRNRPFGIEDGQTVYPDGAEMTAIKMIEFHLSGRAPGVIAETVSRRSVTYEQSASGYPKSIIGSIKRYVSFT